MRDFHKKKSCDRQTRPSDRGCGMFCLRNISHDLYIWSRQFLSKTLRAGNEQSSKVEMSTTTATSLIETYRVKRMLKIGYADLTFSWQNYAYAWNFAVTYRWGRWVLLKLNLSSVGGKADFICLLWCFYHFYVKLQDVTINGIHSFIQKTFC